MNQLGILTLEKNDPKRIIALLEQQVANLTRENEQFKKEAQDDIKSQLIFSNNRQATEVKFRQLKYTTQAMKRLGKQMGLALRYIAQGMENSEPERASDMRQLALVLGDDWWTLEKINSIRAMELVNTTQAYVNAKRIAQGRDAND